MLEPDLRKAVETVVATESGISIPAGASKCTHPSPSDGCRPRTRATSYTMPATLKLSPDSQICDVSGCPELFQTCGSRRGSRARPPGQQY